MTRTISGWRLLALIVTGALLFAGVAVAKTRGASTHAVSATFTATEVPARATRTCTGVDGTYEVTHARYRGTSTGSDDRLSGSLVLNVKSVYNQNEAIGWLEAAVKIRGEDGRVKTHGRLVGVNANGQFAGLLTGHAREGDNNRLIANVSAEFTSAGGFANGQLGTGTANNTALLYANGCGSVKWVETVKKRIVKERSAKSHEKSHKKNHKKPKKSKRR